MMNQNTEQQRLILNAAKKIPLELWGPYVSERQWGTVREDESNNADAWGYLPFEQAHYRAYKWGEDAIAGISDMSQNLCFGITMWNHQDPILKERLFGLNNYEGNHGEDVKELYYHLDNVPSHYYMRYLYKYPQKEFPYKEIKDQNHKKGKLDTEFEILDTDAFRNNEYFDVEITYAKENAKDIFIRVVVTNRAGQEAPFTLLPTLWFFNRWQTEPGQRKPSIQRMDDQHVKASHEKLGNYHFYFPQPTTSLMTENETNWKLVSGKGQEIFTKDAFNNAIIGGLYNEALMSKKSGTKFAPVYETSIPANDKKIWFFRLTNKPVEKPFDLDIDALFQARMKECDSFYESLTENVTDQNLRSIQKKALQALLWSKQFYYYDVEKWIEISNYEFKQTGRNSGWKHLKNEDIISMPDKWEYPWYAAWDLAFQCVPMAMVDPTFAKHQLLLIMREWYMKPDGQLPAYEWNFSDVNPPVQAWAALQVYRIEKQRIGKGDIPFLKRAFHKLIINFTWWLNRKDPSGNNMFEGGFLGLDNIGVFNRSLHLPNAKLEQADGTSWMGMYALNMMDIALEIALYDNSYEDSATKFFEQFVLIAESLNEHGMWNDIDKFFYDTLTLQDEEPKQMQIFSIVGLTSLFAVSTIEKRKFDKLKDFKKRVEWFENYRKRHNRFWPNTENENSNYLLLSLVPKERLLNLLDRLLDESQFLSKYGIRALSRYHKDHPYTVQIGGQVYSIQYDPGDSTSDLFGGNSNWRGPIWMPINHITIHSIRKYGEFYGDDLKVECPKGSGNWLNLEEVAAELVHRLLKLFTRNENDEIPSYGIYNAFYQHAENRDLLLFYEYFHGDNGNGLGASHQTGWTACIAELIHELYTKN